jgi:pimeloyl-ACP methyl ester carboxylesterase
VREFTLLRASAVRPRTRALPALPSADVLRVEDHLVTLPDGRRLGYAEYGAPDGSPVLFFHGLGTTRLICPPDEEAVALGVRLIAVDRPGIGLSDRRPGRRLLDWPADVAWLANALDLDTFAVIGWSGGGPYALACAYLLPQRVRSVGLVSAPAPLADAPSDYLRRFDRNAVRAARRAPWMIRLALWHWGRPQRRDAEGYFESSVAAMIAEDREAMEHPDIRGRMIANSAELYRQGGRGMYDEALVLARRWGFDPAQVRVPVHIWHGRRDTTVPVAMAEHLSRTIPNARMRWYEDEGHHLLYRHWPAILDALR